MTTKFKKLRMLLESENTECILEAHNALSAKIAERSGFKGIWASGLTISASMGLRDCNEASWTQVLSIVELMSEATNVPIVLDADTGYGNFNNVRRLVKKMEQYEIPGMCIEDKIFPKNNSFINSKSQNLVPIEEFVGKIKAAKDAQKNNDFCVIARTEGFIVGCSLEETIERAESYYNAGADAILVHSKKQTAEEVLTFKKKWTHNCPIVIVPTTYHKTPIHIFEAANIKLIIWANHMLRASIKSMHTVSDFIHQYKTVDNLEDKIVEVQDIFNLQDVEELEKAELVYLPF